MLIVSIVAGQYLSYWIVFASHSLLLNNATFTDKVKEKDTLWLVKFYVPWCRYCSSAQVVWEELGKTLDIEDSVEMVHVDCTFEGENEGSRWLDIYTYTPLATYTRHEYVCLFLSYKRAASIY
ncbi:hypothetical protein KP509_25G061900 [Ceratopteris richardii]|uniref:Thioredoxin domain-containing protein n=1 Tax=Ceratopteris richardii TaxID=49495 RepID=A0A8T2RQU7_CERRI|nr:hypothetical protein KP509_25G061900 [Ceratopteris richardii]